MEILSELLQADDPSIRFKTRVDVLGENPRSKKLQSIRAEIADSPRAHALLSERNEQGEIPRRPYSKWDGAHWVLYALAELGYPPGDKSLIPLREQVLGLLFSEEYSHWAHHAPGPKRLHASIDGNAIWAMHTLGLADERVNKLVSRLVEAQWPDGGWNCDPRATGNTSSFHESITPLRALLLHSKLTGDTRARAIADRAGEIFLQRRLYKRLHNGHVMNPRFLQFHYPCYWHYDILLGLTVMQEGGWLDDSRCKDALDLLESKRLSNGGWAAEAKFYRPTRKPVLSGRSLINWGPVGVRTRNDFVTVRALTILQGAGRYNSENK